jgi:hypothetical protein
MKDEGKGKKEKGKRKKYSRDCNFFSETVLIASLKRRQSANETLALTQNYGHIHTFISFCLLPFAFYLLP